MSYNLLKFPGNTDERVFELRKIFDQYRPDILINTEMQDIEGVQLILTEALNHQSNEYNSFFHEVNNRDTEIALFYKPAKITLLDTVMIPTDLRTIAGFIFNPVNHSNENYKFTVFGGHLKASPGTENEQKRWLETKQLQNYIADQSVDFQYIFCGDFNFYSADEPGYSLLMDSLNIDLEDPINMPGNWHDNPEFAAIHTQSPRTVSFGGGAVGGLDDRFDFILLSEQFFSGSELSYITDSYITIGNDGNHFDISVNHINTA